MNVPDPDAPRRRTRFFLGNPYWWPLWPLLPLVNRERPGEPPGRLLDLEGLLGTGECPWQVFLTDSLFVPLNLAELREIPREPFRTPDELLDAGWRVD